MAEIDNRFKVKKGLDVLGNSSFVGDSNVTGNLSVTGNITLPTLVSTDNSTKAATTAFVKTAISNLVASSPATLDTLNELATALGNDANFATTMTNNLALKAPLASPTLTGVPTAPTAAASTNTTQLATTAFVTTADNLKANLASPALTGTPTAPTASIDTNTTQIATTAFVAGQAASVAPLMNSTAAVGTSIKFARQDHVHASDTAKASLAGAAFTGAVTIANNLTVNNGDIKQSGPKVISNTNSALYLQTDSAQPIILRTSGTAEKMRILDTGRVLIGTPTDNGVDLVQVNGDVIANTFKGSAALTGSPTAPTAVAGTNTTQIATTEFANTAVANGNINSILTGNTTTSSLSNSNYTLIALPAGASITTSAASITGAIKIKLPVLYTNAMMSMRVNVYEHSTGKSFTMSISGYNYDVGPTWQSTTAVMEGTPLGKLPNVRFGNDGTTCCIWIGDVTDMWAYPQVFVTDVMLGFGGNSSAWASGWAVTFETVLDTVKATVVPTKNAGLASPALTGTPTAPTATAGTNTTQIATTAFVTTADNLKANLASPALTGTPTAPTAVAGTNTTQIATTAFVSTAVSNLIASAPGALDTLNELSSALGNDANFATTVSNNLALKATIASPDFTGIPTAPTAAPDTNTSQLATTAFVLGQFYLKASTASSTYAPLASPSLTGTPIAPTAATTVNNTQVATTAFVHSALDAVTTKAITGSVTLTATEALSRILIFTGELTANAIITIPTASAQYIIDNRTTGAFTLTIKQAAGTGVNITQGFKRKIFSDGTNVYFADNDYTDAVIGGVPTTTTAPSTDNSTRVASTAHVKAAIIASNTVKNDSTSSADPFGLVTVNANLTMNAGWQDTGVVGSSHLTTGSYIVQIYANDSAVGGGHVDCYYSGTMSWFAGATTNLDNDEVELHQSGGSNGGNTIYLRTQNVVGGNAKLQIAGDLVNGSASTYIIKFRRII